MQATHIGQDMGKEHGALMPSPGTPLSRNLHVCSLPQKVSELSPFEFLWRLHYITKIWLIKSLATDSPYRPSLSFQKLGVKIPAL